MSLSVATAAATPQHAPRKAAANNSSSSSHSGHSGAEMSGAENAHDMLFKVSTHTHKHEAAGAERRGREGAAEQQRSGGSLWSVVAVLSHVSSSSSATVALEVRQTTSTAKDTRETEERQAWNRQDRSIADRALCAPVALLVTSLCVLCRVVFASVLPRKEMSEATSEQMLSELLSFVSSGSHSIAWCCALCVCSVKKGTAHTIGVEFGSKILSIGKRKVKLQIWVRRTQGKHSERVVAAGVSNELICCCALVRSCSFVCFLFCVCRTPLVRSVSAV